MGSLQDVSALRTAKELIDSEDKWTQVWFAADADNQMCSTDEAVRFCAVGALYKAQGISLFAPKTRAITDPLHYLESTTPVVVAEDDRGGEIHVNIPPQAYNDAEGRTHEEIMEWYDKAISMAMPR